MGKNKKKKLNGDFPIWFLEEAPRYTIPDDQIDYGYCVNCQINDPYILKLVILEKVRKGPMDCLCGCKVGIFDMDIEKYRSWDITSINAWDKK